VGETERKCVGGREREKRQTLVFKGVCLGGWERKRERGGEGTERTRQREGGEREREREGERERDRDEIAMR